MNFLYKPPEWYSEGTEPEKELKKKGFTAGYKPPAAYFNWFFHRVYLCLTELIEKITDNEKRIKENEYRIGSVGSVIIGTEDTELNVNDTLFIVDELPEKKPFEGAAFTNLVFQTIAPDGKAENWADTSSAEMMMLLGDGEDNKNIISGKLTVAEEATPGTVFFAKIEK